MSEYVPPFHLAAVEVPPDFSEVVADLAMKENRTFGQQLLAMAMAGAECARLHSKESR